MQAFDDRFQAESGWNTLTVLGSGHETYQCRKLLMMGRENARNM